MVIGNIVHHDRDLLHARIFNAWVEYWDSNILRTQYQENEQQLLHKYKNIRFLEDEYNQTYIIAPENLVVKGNTRGNKQYCLVGQPLNCRDGDNVDLLK